MTTDYLKVESTLRDLIGPTHLHVEELAEENLPLFLLADLDPDLVVFAAVNGQPEDEYGRAMERFKFLYADAGEAWAERDLTLVVCTQKPNRKLSAYWNKVELDRYFCRKFVIDASENLSGQLTRLPFIPLNPQRVAGLARPLSAQTLLRRKHGVEAWLADALAVAGGRSPGAIVTRSLAAQNPPIFQDQKMESFVGSPVAQQPGVRIKNIHLENFRAYCDQDIDFQADIIVLYGPNGLGKTSLFDALDFLCTGGVARFDDRYAKNRQKAVAALPRLGSRPDQALVRATISVDGKEFQVERQVSDAVNAKVNGSILDRKGTLIKLANLPKSTKMDLRIENFVRLFRATHLFGQDSASLTCDIQNKSMLSEETVARMLAFQDYVEVIGKSEKVSNELAGMIDLENSRRSTTVDVLKAKQIELQNLSTVAVGIEAPEVITRKGEELAKEVYAASGVEFEPQVQITPSAVQGWRGLLEGRLNHLREQLANAKDAESRFPRLQESTVNLKSLNDQHVSKTEQLAEARILLGNQRQQLDEIETNRSALLETQRNVALQIDSLKWLVDNAAECELLTKQVKNIEEELHDARANSSRVRADRERTAAESNIVANRIRELQQHIQSEEKELSLINGFLATLGAWHNDVKRLDELTEAITKATEKSRGLETEIGDVGGQLQQASALMVSAEKLLDDAQLSQSEVQTLLDSLTQHITSEVCLLCGTPHKNQAELRSAIERHRGTQDATVRQALLQVQSTKSQVENLERKLDGLRQSQLLITIDLNSFTEERDNTLARLERYADQALALGIAETDPEKCEKPANARVGVLVESLRSKRDDLLVQTNLLENKQKSLMVETEQRDRGQQNVVALEARQRGATSLLSQLEIRAAEHQVEFAQASNAASQLARLEEQFGRHKLDLDASNEALAKAKAEVNRVRSDIDQLEKAIHELESQLLGVRRAIAEIEQVLARLGYSVDTTAGDVGSFRMRLEEQEVALENLRSRVIDFEIALDAAQTQAAVVKMQDELATLRKTEDESNTRLTALKKWRDYFDQINNALSNIQQVLLDEYVDKYGPLASKIQQRLRPVYGFGDLKLSAEQGGIAVTVERNGEKYPPSDYFSESQLQIVMLSLFLSAVLTQTWSSFGLILLDDPVTHLDDLNEYALLDVIRGLVDTDVIRHQFVVSTCEERLYRLMRQRFSKVKTDVAFYEFQSIGDNGPVIVRR